MKTILVPLDGSAEADTVLTYIPQLARSLSARICLLRVLPDHYDGGPVLHEIVASYGVADGMVLEGPVRPSLDTRRQQAEGDHLAALIGLRAQGFEVELEVEVGHPAEMIVEMATTKGAGLIAMATHGWGGLRRWALGSVTDKVIHAAPAPVFVVRSTLDPAPAPELRRVLVPIDRSALSRKALPLAAQLAAANGAQILLLHVLPPPPLFGPVGPHIGAELAQIYTEPDYEMRTQSLAELQSIGKELYERYGVTVSCDVRAGLPAEAIVDLAEQRHVDLVVMGTHGYSGLRRWALGSVADKVLHACPTPLILVRSSEVAP